MAISMEEQNPKVTLVTLEYLHKGGPAIIGLSDSGHRVSVYPESQLKHHDSRCNPKLKEFFLSGKSYFKGKQILVEIYKKATETTEFDYLATARPFEEQPQETQYYIEKILSKLENQLPLPPAKQKNTKTSFNLPKALNDKIHSTRYDEFARAKLCVDEKQFRNAFAVKAFELGFQWLNDTENCNASQAIDPEIIDSRSINPIESWCETDEAVAKIISTREQRSRDAIDETSVAVLKAKADELGVQITDLINPIIRDSYREHKGLWSIQINDPQA